MTWQQWVLVGLLALAAIVNVLSVGAPRKPTTPVDATIALLLSAFAIWLVVSL